MAIMVVVGIVTPVFYLLYYEVLTKADVSHHAVPTEGPGEMSHGHLNGNNVDPPVGKDSHEGAEPENYAANVLNENVQGPNMDKARDHGHGLHEKT